ncbi:MAG TPA: hypothetical protein VHC90_15005 [Bryobacteraceae bacterium]|nr:hypothetical protein [Bryobacteraceae bacterium]
MTNVSCVNPSCALPVNATGKIVVLPHATPIVFAISPLAPIRSSLVTWMRPVTSAMTGYP